MEILVPEQYDEYEHFVATHPQSSFTQSVMWRKVKSNWGFEVVVSRGADGKIIGGLSVLIQKVPLMGTSFLYSPRGPVCDLHDEAVMRDLKMGVDELAKRYKAHIFKMDPDTLATDTELLELTKKMGFEHFAGPEGFETIQARFNYRLYIEGKTEDEVLAAITQKTRYNIRVAQKHGVEVHVVGEEYLDDFVRIMQTTGERDGFNVRPKEYFVRMLNALGENVRLYMAFYEGQPISGAITTNYGGKTCYVYGASDNVYRNVMPNYLVQWEMICWAVETGCSVYDFQGVSGILDESNHMYGLYRFKKGFNGQLDELIGEFNYVYRPLEYKMVEAAIAAKEKLSEIKRVAKK
ncbi:MAG: peptidoglycan bridge formation glycyltransferase FemA/FemB family protein [Hydrogenoanaerobacterium sp.]